MIVRFRLAKQQMQALVNGLVGNSGSPPGTGGVARSAGGVAKSKSFPLYSYDPSQDPLRDPAALLS